MALFCQQFLPSKTIYPHYAEGMGFAFFPNRDIFPLDEPFVLKMISRFIRRCLVTERPGAAWTSDQMAVSIGFTGSQSCNATSFFMISPQRLIDLTIWLQRHDEHITDFFVTCRMVRFTRKA